MSAVANIVLQDAQATPVAHTFIPIGPDTNGVWWFEDQSASSPVGYNRISIQLVRAKNPTAGENAGDRINRVKIGLHTPTLETLGTNDAGITPPPTVAYILRAQTEYIISDRSSLQNRKDVRKFNYNLQNDAQIIAMVEQLQNIY